MGFKTKAVGLILIAMLAALVWRLWQEKQTVMQTQVTSWTEDHSADCGVVLTGYPGRVREGLDLLNQNQIQKLIISGVYPKAELKDIFRQWPYYGNVNAKDVILEKRSGSTFGNAQQSLPLVEALKCRDIVLITSRIHMYRSLRIFRAVFPQNFPIYPRAVIYGQYHPKAIDLWSEVLKSLFYSLWAY